MGKIIKENGKIWFEEYQTVDKRHKRMTLIGTYEEEPKEEDKPKKKKSN